MKKLSKDDLKAREEAVGKLKTTFEELTEAVSRYNDVMATEWATVEEAQNAYNEALHAAQEWSEGIATQIEDFINDKSDKWKEGEKGDAYENWKGTFEAIDFTESELSQPDELSVEVENPCEEIEGLPEEVES